MSRKKTNPNSLYNVKANNNYVIDKVPNANLLPCLGIYPKSIVSKKYRYRLGGPVILVTGNREVAIGKDIAENIIVSEVK
ncbi:MAG: FeoA family protein [Miniphocaeibacter sp.]|uniref:FeoA family protein n=1 Tax=Miniphocaeibacter sp. TaxID=3100973 RepID=UPI00183CBAA1|nr:ferrous iron transport protein A [Gallicola sp.]